MAIKYTIQGYLIYTTIAAYLLALLCTISSENKEPLMFCIFSALLSRLFHLTYRWYHVRHVPMQNLFEVFLCLGMIYPITIFSKKYFVSEARPLICFLGVVVLFPAGFIFNAQPERLPPALQSWLFAPHVAVYILAYIFMAKAAFQAVLQLAGKNDSM